MIDHVKEAVVFICHYIISAACVIGGAIFIALSMKAAVFMHSVLMECGISSAYDLIDNLRPVIASSSMTWLVSMVIASALYIWATYLSLRLIRVGLGGFVSQPYLANGIGAWLTVRQNKQTVVTITV